MAFRSDITVDWSFSPRIIWVNWTDAASRELTLQDLVDTCRTLESDLNALDDKKLLNAVGKTPLGGGQSTALTVTMQNAVVAFRANDESTLIGTAEAEPTGRILNDASATFVADGVKPGWHVHNETDHSTCTVLSVRSQTQLITTKLTDGSNNFWTVGDEYHIHEVVGCSITGGNLVAVDKSSVPMDAFFPTGHVFVEKTSSASATVQDLDALRYASYGSRVTVDLLNGVPGTAYPVGNMEHPVDNVANALTIARTIGIDRLYFIGNADIDGGNDLHDLIIEGQNPLLSQINIQASCDTTDCTFRNAYITGALDTNTWLEDCVVGDLSYVEGTLLRCGLHGELTLGGTAGAILLDCHAARLGTGSFTSVINLGGSGRNCAVHNFSGHLTIRNLTGPSIAGISFARGSLVIENTVSAGMVHVMGLCKITDDHTGTAVIKTNYQAATQAVAQATLAEATLARQKLLNNEVLTEGATDNWTTLADDGFTPLFRHTVTDKDGHPISIPAGAPAVRTRTL